MNSTDVSMVEYGSGTLSMVTKGQQDKFVDGGSEKRIIYMHRVTLISLMPGHKYGQNKHVNIHMFSFFDKSCPLIHISKQRFQFYQQCLE